MEKKDMLKKTMDIAGDVVKIAANASEKQAGGPTDNSTRNDQKTTTGSQNIQIQLDTQKKREPRPIEKHIHEFPDNRAMTEAECDLALKKAQMEYELMKSEQLHSQVCQNREWEHKLEVEKKNEKKRKVRSIIAGVLAAIGAGYTGYTIWSDYKRNKNATVTPTPVPQASDTTTGGDK